MAEPGFELPSIWSLDSCSFHCTSLSCIFSGHFLSVGSLLCLSCMRADSLPAVCCHLQEPGLPWTLFKFIVLVLLSFSKLLKSILVSQDFIWNLSRHIHLYTLLPNKTRFIHCLKSESVVAIVLKDQGTLLSISLCFSTFSRDWPALCADLCPSVPLPLPFRAWPHATHPAGPCREAVLNELWEHLWSGPPCVAGGRYRDPAISGGSLEEAAFSPRQTCIF